MSLWPHLNACDHAKFNSNLLWCNLWTVFKGPHNFMDTTLGRSVRCMGCDSVRFSCSPTSSSQIYETQFGFASHVEALGKTRIKVKPPFISCDYHRFMFLDASIKWLHPPPPPLSPSILWTFEPIIIDKFWVYNPISFKHMSCWTLFLDPT